MACEKWDIRLVDTGRDLLEVPSESKTGTKAALLVGDPDYGARVNTSITTRSEGASAFGLGNRGSTRKPPEPGSRFATEVVAASVDEAGSRIERSLTLGLKEDIRGFAFSNLPGTAAEVTALQSELTEQGFSILDLLGSGKPKRWLRTSPPRWLRADCWETRAAHPSASGWRLRRIT